MKALLFCLVALASSIVEDVHDIHLSVCDIVIKENKVEITLKTFLDDLQLAVGISPGEPLPDGYSSAEELITQYVQNTIKTSLGPMVVTDFSASPNAVWIEMSAVLSDPPKTLQIDNTFLTEIYRDQTNLVKIKHLGKTKTYTLNKKKKALSHDL